MFLFCCLQVDGDSITYWGGKAVLGATIESSRKWETEEKDFTGVVVGQIKQLHALLQGKVNVSLFSLSPPLPPSPPQLRSV